MRSQVNFNYLESFITVAKNKSFSLAARELNVAQPVISKQIQLLESMLGYQLFKRTRKEIILTPEGQKLLIQIHQPFHQICQGIASFSTTKDEIRGPLHFATYQEVGERSFLPHLISFQKKYPQIQLFMDFIRGHEMDERLRKGQIDFGHFRSTVST